MDEYAHVPVLLKEAVDLLVTDVNGVYVDGTAGGGGHTAEVLQRLDAGGRVIAFDADARAIEACRKRFGTMVGRQLALVNRNFNELGAWLAGQDLQAVNGVLLDLGVSSFQLDADVGFSYRSDSPLDMRFHFSQQLSAKDIVNDWPVDDLTRVLREYGEEPMAWRIANAIVRSRPIQTTFQLRDAIIKEIPQQFQVKRLARVFQGLRIAVNDELGSLRKALAEITTALVPGGRVVVIAYHSLEDRIVKDFFRYEALDCVCPPGLPVCICGKVSRLRILTRKAMVPSVMEVEANPRARSAKMRAAERV